MRITFENPQGQGLAARLERPLGPPRAWALFAHCFTCSKDLSAARRLSEALVEEGYGVLRFDFTGLGESAGEFAETTFSSNVGDLLAASEYLRREHDAPRVLIGHSLGGAAVLAAAGRIPEAKGVVTIGAPFEPSHVRTLIDAAAPDLEAQGEAQVVLAGRPFRIKRDFLDDLMTHNQPDRIAALEKALLILHAPLDDVVGIDNARQIFQAAKHPKSFVSLDGADHLLSNRRDAEYVGRVIAAWAGRYLDPPSGEKEHDLVEVRGGPRGFKTDIVASGHPLRADEPTSVPGGTDTGPSPYDLLLAGLGACTSMTLHMYARRKQWPLEEVRVRLRHHKIHAKDCQDCETTQGRVDQIEREISLSGPLDAEQRQRILEIADRCPVHRTLESEIKIRTREA